MPKRSFKDFTEQQLDIFITKLESKKPILLINRNIYEHILKQANDASNEKHDLNFLNFIEDYKDFYTEEKDKK